MAVTARGDDVRRHAELGVPLLEPNSSHGIVIIPASAGRLSCRFDMSAAASSIRRGVAEVVMKDTRKTIHAFKMALALVLAFLLVLVHAPYRQLGSHAVWAIMTVIVVFEFTIGATLSKGLNRGAGTLVAGLLAIGVGEVAACMSGSFGHPLLIGFSAFLVGGIVTFAKLWPSLKPYEFGFRTLLLTFSLIMVAEYQGGDPLHTAVNRFLIILLGATIGVLVNVFVLPCWAGNDLHHSLVSNFYGVADSLEACVNEYLHGTILERVPWKVQVMEKPVDDLVFKGYRSTLSSASKEESLAGFASWEPPHGRFKGVKYPWHLYVKLGAVLRHCAYSIVALHGCLQSAIQAPLQVRKLFEVEIRTLGNECALVLRKLGRQVENMQAGDFATLLQDVEHAIFELQQSLYYRSYLLVHKESRDVKENAGKVAVSLVTTLPAQQERQPLSSNNLILNYAHEELLNHSDRKFLKRMHSWPSQLDDNLDCGAKEPLLEQRVRVVESASVLSVGTFATLLMEVASRLEYVVDAVSELSDLAKFTNMKEEEDTYVRIQLNGHHELGGNFVSC